LYKIVRTRKVTAVKVFSQSEASSSADALGKESFGKFVRRSPVYAERVRTVLFGIQLAAAWVDIVGCMLVFAFLSAIWWATHRSPSSRWRLSMEWSAYTPGLD